MLLVDGAAHVWSRDRRLFPWRPLTGEPPHAAYDGAPELLERALAESGSAGAVLVQPSVYGADHSFLARAVEEGRGRFAGVLLWDHRHPRALELAATTLARHRLAGIRLSAEHDGGWFAGTAGEPAWNLCAEASRPLSILCRPDDLDAVGEWADRCPDVTVVVDHLGLLDPGTGGTSLLRLMAAHTNVAVRVSALGALSQEPWPYADLWPVLRALLAEAGADRMVYGTDWPFVDDRVAYDGTVRALDEALSWTPDDRCRVLGETAIRLWGLDRDALARPWAGR